MELPARELGSLEELMDGHTSEGAWPVTLDFTADQVKMLIRSIETAVMSSGSHDETMQVIAYREFLKEILEVLRIALKEQHP